MKKFYVTLLAIFVFASVLWMVGEPATAAEPSSSQSVQPAEGADLGQQAAEDQLLGRNRQLDSLQPASSCGTPTCIFPNCQPGSECKDKCLQAYDACLTYCDAVTCRCLARQCLDCCKVK